MEIDKNSVQFLTKAPRNHNFGSHQCLRKYHPLKYVSGNIDKTAQDSSLAVLFLRKDWSSRSSFRDQSTDNSSCKTSHFREFKSSKTLKRLRKNTKSSKALIKQIVDKRDTLLKEKKSLYSICTICALKKKKKISPNVEEKQSSEQETTSITDDSDSTDTDQYQECISNISSTDSINSQKQTKVSTNNSGNLIYNDNKMLSRETQTSFILSDAGGIWPSSNGYDRALKIDYGKRNYLSYKNVFENKTEINYSSVKVSKEDTDVEEEYMIKCLKYTSPDTSYQHHISPSKLKITQNTNKRKCKQTNNMKYPTRSLGDKGLIPDNHSTPSTRKKIRNNDTKPKVQLVSTIHLEESTNIKKFLKEKKHIKNKQNTFKKDENQSNIVSPVVPDMHEKAVKFMKREYMDKHRTNQKKDENFYKIKLLEMARNEIMGHNYTSADWNKRKILSHRKTTLKQKLPLYSFTESHSNLNLTKNSSYMIGCYQNAAPSTPSVKLKVKKTRKLKG